MKLVSVEEMRLLEKLTDEGGQSYAAMMEEAGWSVARTALVTRLATPPNRVTLLVGPGNNGGDGLVAGHYLREAEYDVVVYLWKRDIKGDENFSRLKRRKRGVTIVAMENDPDFAKLRDVLRKSNLVIDALLGTGVTRPLEGRIVELLTVVKEELALRNSPSVPAPAHVTRGVPRLPLVEALDVGFGPVQGTMVDEEDWLDEDELADAELIRWPLLPVLAVDCPSGLNCDTGAIDPAALAADVTVTFAFPKWGQVQYPGAGACGLLNVVDIGVPIALEKGLRTELLNREDLPSLPARPRDANKGTFGKAMVVGGSVEYTGAPALSASAAARTGAGLVTVAVPREVHAMLAGSLLHLTWLPLPSVDGIHSTQGAQRLLERLGGYDALLVGPGLSTEDSARGFFDALLSPGALEPRIWRGRAVFDADALNLLSKTAGWPARLPPESVLTPHPGEMSRLTGLSIAEINGNRIATARRYAGEWGHVVLLKGPHTVVAHPDGRVSVLPFAEPALAKAGSGDVLSGVILALIAQGMDSFAAARLGAYIHGVAGCLAGGRLGAASVTARDLLEMLPQALGASRMQERG